MIQPGMLIVDTKRCIACKRCMTECAVAHSRSKDLAGAMRETPRPEPRVWVKEVGPFAAPYQCRHCETPPCVPACPNAALSKDAASGIVVLNLDACAGAAKCVKKCPFLGIQMNLAGAQAVKCDLCVTRLEAGGIPACAEACPVDAIIYKKFEDLTDEEKALRSGRPGAALVRRTHIRYWVDPAKCIACRKCWMICPAQAIQGEKKTPHKVLQDKCVTCGGCYLVCPVNAVQAMDPEKFDEVAQAEPLTAAEPAPEAQAAAEVAAEPFAEAPAPEPQQAEPEPAPAAPEPAAPGTSKKQRRIERKIKRKAKKGKGGAN
ncbi:MAG TPA: 4Fe-4S binding protein [Planctomycetota bacterium]|nr:4Fe-4S binding protein [Planctomycetota bacterium]HRR81824.1 4Fe-4S binding protein [Planctomycetota bacterium]HRT96334.1 4Fe-4S binding protein [Planctomycetota bacterium]